MNKIIQSLGFLIIGFGIYSINFFFFLQINNKFLTQFNGHIQRQLKNVINAHNYELIYVISLSIILIGFIIFYFSKKNKYYHFNFIRRIKNSIKNIKKVEKPYTIAFICIMGIAIFSVYTRMFTRVGYDEAFTSLYYEPSLHALLNYIVPLPNNHLLNSILMNIGKNIFPFSTLINIRVFPGLITCINFILLFICLSKLINTKTALILLILFVFNPGIVKYYVAARGYNIILLACIICFYCTIKMICENISKRDFIKYLLLFSLGMLIGFYTMPSFIYPYFAFTTFMFFILVKYRYYNKLKVFILFNFINGILVFSAFIPTLLNHGIDNIKENKFFIPRVLNNFFFQDIWKLFSNFTEQYFNINLIFFLILLVGICIALLFFIKNKQHVNSIYLSTYVILICPLLLILQKAIPFPRTFLYLIVPILYLIGLLLSKIKANSKIFYLFIIVFYFLNFKKLTNNDFEKSKHYQVVNFLLKKNAKNVLYPKSYPNYNFFLFYYKNNDKKKQANVYFYNKKYEISTYLKKYPNSDFIVLDNTKQNISNYKLVKQIRNFQILKKE